MDKKLKTLFEVGFSLLFIYGGLFYDVMPIGEKSILLFTMGICLIGNLWEMC